MEKRARQFLRRMINTGGFVAGGLYDEHPHYWHNNRSYSSRLVNLGILGYLVHHGYLKQNNSGRYLVTEEGYNFAKPWYLKLF